MVNLSLMPISSISAVRTWIVVVLAIRSGMLIKLYKNAVDKLIA